MTFSIVAREGDAFGVAVASKFLASGAVVPGARIGVGAVATQSLARVAYIEELLTAMAAGESAQEALDAAVAADEGRADRQVGVVGVSNSGAQSAATFTGADCNPWCGGKAFVDEDGHSAFAVQGNILVGPEVIEAMEQAWLGSAGKTFPQRLLAALAAGDAAGGDSRGRQSAAIYAVAPGSGYDRCGVAADLRVDDHADPVGELARLLEQWELYFGAPEGVQPLEGALADEVRAKLAVLGHEAADVSEALTDWANEENYESRLSPDGIDARLLDVLRGGGPTS